MKNNTRSSRGFTIIELLIVIVVIAILAVITIVVFGGIRERAELSQAKSLLDQARKKAQLYHVENDAYPSTMAAAGVQDQNGTSYAIASSESDYCIAVTTSGKTYRVIGDGGSVEPGACQAGTVNLALNATATASSTASYSGPISRVTDGSTDTNSYFEAEHGTASVTVDLGSLQYIGRVVVWHYSGDPRSYNNNVTQISADGSTWTTIFNSSVSGIHMETSSGHSMSFTPTQARYIRDSITGSSNNPGNHWVEIQAY